MSKKTLGKKGPHYLGQKVEEKIKYFTKIRFNYGNIGNLEEYYNAIRDAMGRFNQSSSVSILFRNKERRNKVRGISIPTPKLGTYKKFRDAYQEIVEGRQAGSDAVNFTEDEIEYGYFSLASVSAIGFGSSEDMMYEVEGIEETKRQVGKKQVGNKDCSRLCLHKLIQRTIHQEEAKNAIINLLNTPLKELQKLDGVIEFIKKNELPINVIANSFTLMKFPNEIVDNAGDAMKEIFMIDNKKINREYACAKMVLDKDVELVYLHRGDHCKATIIYDEVNKHFDIIQDNKIQFYDNVYISNCAKVIKDDKVLFTAKQRMRNTQKEISVKLIYLVFDYETVIDFDLSSCMQEYSLSVLKLTNTELEELTSADERKDEATVQSIRRRCCVTYTGFDCTAQFIEWLLIEQVNTAFVLIGFNNANFDNFILLDGLLKYQEHAEFSVRDIFYNGSQLLNFYISGRHNTFDIHKHLMGSLKDNCDSFKINCCAKKSFDHDVSQQKYLNGELIDWITNNEELREYNEYDVLATAVLFCKYRRALENTEAMKPYAPILHDIKTVGSLIYKVATAAFKEKIIQLPKLTHEEYTDLQKCKIAGRVELFNGVRKITNRLVSTDVCSLYPYVMCIAPVYYPCGEKINTNDYMGDDVIGFYYCDIDQSNLRAMNLPKIYAKKTAIENDWGHDEVLEDYLISNVMIKLLRKFDCKVEIKKGFYFTEKRKSCEMFDFLLDFMKGKNDQDTKKANKDPTYNSALRETLKLLMNSLSGKVIEGLHTEKTTDINSIDEYNKLVETSKSINCINAIGSKIFITYEVESEDIINKQRPIYLGVLIYDYAKSYMFEHSFSKVGLADLLYTDTDASKFEYTKFLEWKKNIDDNNIQVPHWEEVEDVDARYKDHKIYESGSKVFGSFEDELDEMIGKKYVFYCLEKKSWLYSCGNGDKETKFRFKGLNGSAIPLTLKENFVGVKTIKHKETADKEAWVETKYRVKEGFEIEVYNFAQKNKNKCISLVKDKGGQNEVKFFEDLFTNKVSYLHCNSFRKIVKNSAKDVELGDAERYNSLMNKVQVNYMVKCITLKNF